MAQVAEVKVQKWHRPSHKHDYGFDQMVDEIQKFTSVLSHNGAPVTYRVYIGTDSQRHGQKYNMVTAIGVTRTDSHGIGRGSIYFHASELYSHLYSIHLKLSTEAWLTLSTFNDLKEALEARGMKIPIELHFDVNPNPKEKSSIALAEVVGMAKGSGCDAWKVKPEAWCASALANRHSK